MDLDKFYNLGLGRGYEIGLVIFIRRFSYMYLFGGCGGILEVRERVSSLC